MAWSNVVKYTDAEISGIGMTSQRTRDRMAERLQAQGIQDRRVLQAMAEVPRHLFMDEAMASRAYEDVALPIGGGQTISQPYIVAKMTELVMSVEGVTKVLEVGTGSGYQAAILSRLIKNVYTCERIRKLLRTAADRFKRLTYDNLETKYTDGSWGWPEEGPFDAIIVTAAPESVPEALFEQLADGGLLVCPVGPQRGEQNLTVVRRVGDEYQVETKEPVKFVPLIRGKS